MPEFNIPHDDQVLLQRMLDAGREALSLVHGETRQSLQMNQALTQTLVTNIKTVCETAGQITAEARNLLPGVSWCDALALSNHVIRVNLTVDLDALWDRLTNELPQLVSILERTLAAY